MVKLSEIREKIFSVRNWISNKKKLSIFCSNITPWSDNPIAICVRRPVIGRGVNSAVRSCKLHTPVKAHMILCDIGMEIVHCATWTKTGHSSPYVNSSSVQVASTRDGMPWFSLKSQTLPSIITICRKFFLISSGEGAGSVGVRVMSLWGITYSTLFPTYLPMKQIQTNTAIYDKSWLNSQLFINNWTWSLKCKMKVLIPIIWIP